MVKFDLEFVPPAGFEDFSSRIEKAAVLIGQLRFFFFIYFIL